MANENIGNNSQSVSNLIILLYPFKNNNLDGSNRFYGSNQGLWVQSSFMGPIKVYESNQRFMGPIKISFIFMNKGCEHESEISF